MLASGDVTAEIATAVEPRDFHSQAHADAFDAICAVYRARDQVDLDAVAEWLQNVDALDRVGGKDYLQELLRDACAQHEAEALADLVRGAGFLRRLEQVGARIAAEARAASPADADDIYANVTQQLTDASREQSGYAQLADVMDGALDEIESISNRSGRIVGVPTGFADLDLLTQGLQAGQLWVIAGRPGMGKGALALNLARSCSIKNAMTSAVFSLKLRRNEVSMRLLSAESRVALHHMRSGTMTDDDWARLARRIGEVSAAPLFIDDTADLTFTQIRARARSLRERHDLRLLIIDTINMMTYGTRRFDNRYLEISEIARCLKQLAKELEIPIVAVSQLNRGPEQRIDRRPALPDLRDAGTLEDNADVVLLLHREAAYDPESPRAGEADFIVAKHRNGPCATITAAFQGHYMRFVDMQQS